jgi:prepilin-type N-terminal cleavage/methylation domain-containing protein
MTTTNRRGFTLTEMLVVIGIIILVTLLAVPAFKAMTGSKSTEAAQNIISSVLARARTEALGLQEPRGILFYRDLDSLKIGMVMVKPTNTTAPWELDLVADRDPVLLPNAVGMQFIDDDTPAANDEDRYIGFNTAINRLTPTDALATKVSYGGVILFDGQGQVTSDTYSFRVRKIVNPVTGAIGPTELGRFLYNDPALPGTTPQVLTPNPFAPVSKLGFVLFDEETFVNQFGQGRTNDAAAYSDTQVDNRVVFGGPNDSPPEEAAEEKWLNENSTPILVNRYNGTLLRGE